MFQSEIENAKNKNAIVCLDCNSKILNKNLGSYTMEEKFIPKTTQSRSYKDIETELISEFWMVEDIFTFENIGFSHSSDGKITYLCCADCEVGPLGYHDLSTRASFVALARVKHVTEI